MWWLRGRASALHMIESRSLLPWWIESHLRHEFIWYCACYWTVISPYLSGCHRYMLDGNSLTNWWLTEWFVKDCKRVNCESLIINSLNQSGLEPALELHSRAASSVAITSPFLRSQHRKQFQKRADHKKEPVTRVVWFLKFSTLRFECIKKRKSFVKTSFKNCALKNLEK